eukprot:CAMPEP_0171984736 /NCGR_PEP_ID=MMETSP0993-20121228/273983_1 /TAXON_ID=483369 /ORGANISM="non described non described, Strain CCMP2098" /LENGTH=259 /DNA_ID=CAMNT_0012637569 /DNA_START=86 /DNA_END=865 /DNA_ORIENTATION=-
MPGKFLIALFLLQAETTHSYMGFTRRRLIFGGSAAALVGVAPQQASAAERNNILMSKPLEKFRILRQEAADNLQYDGELAPINVDESLRSPTTLLVPIVRINTIVRQVRDSIDDPGNWEGLRKTLNSPPLSKVEFKKAFNAYADNIYYSAGSERANAYLAGGASPTTQQTTQYLLRNEILANVEISVLELDYLIKLRDKGEMLKEELVGTELDDLRGFLDKALQTLDQYLAIAKQEDDANLANVERMKRERKELFAETP